jgi:hypothetical protein
MGIVFIGNHLILNLAENDTIDRSCEIENDLITTTLNLPEKDAVYLMLTR